MYFLQPSLFPFDEYVKMDSNDRLVMVLSALNAAPLLNRLEEERKGRRNDYPVRSMWYTLIAGIVYEIPTISGLIRELERNPGLRYLCGIKSQREVPRPWTYSRFLNHLVRHAGYLDAMMRELVNSLSEALPGFGETLVIDSTDVAAYSNRFRKPSSDSDAGWGVKTKSSSGSNKANDRYYWLGYKLHLIVDARYELPVQYQVTAANVNDTTQLIPQIEDIRVKQPELLGRTEYLVADAGYDSEKNHRYLYERLGIKGIIPLNLGNEKEPPGICNSLGTPLCAANKPMSYAGYDNGFLKYRAPCIVQGFDCPLGVHGRCCHPKSYGTVVKLRVRDNPRRYSPVPRESKKWKRIYRKRTAIERVNSRLKRHLLIDQVYVRGKRKVATRLGLSVLVMLAAAVAMAKRGQYEKVRSVVQLVA